MTKQQQVTRDAGIISTATRVHVHCDQCEMVSINGLACHETACPNARSQWRDGQWIRMRECFECGYELPADEACNCTEAYELDEPTRP
jgi:hypothetical protein